MARITPSSNTLSKIVRAILDFLHVGKKMNLKALPPAPNRPQLPAPKPSGRPIRDPHWKPPSGWHRPASGKGSFTGAEGNSPFKLNDATADHLGLPRGTEIDFVNGTPDFGPFTHKGLGGQPPGTYNVDGINLNRSHDRRATIDAIADAMGMTKEDVAEALQKADVDFHHFLETQCNLSHTRFMEASTTAEQST